MNRLYSAGLILLLGAGSAMAAVDPVLLNLVMPDATILSGVQVAQSVASPFGQYILSRIQSNDPGLQKFITATGFDPLTDLNQILAATNADGRPARGATLILGRGSFNVAQLTSAATLMGATETQYRGVNILTAKRSPNSVAFLDGTTAVMGNMALVQAVIDRNLSGATFSGPLAQQAQSVSATNQAWFATTVPISDFLNGNLTSPNLSNLTQSNLLQSILQTTGGVNFGASGVSITADATTSSTQNAQALADVLKFLVSMIQTNSASTNLSSIADAATFSANGAVMHVTLSLPEQQVEQLLATPRAPRVRKVAASRQ